MMKDHVHMLLSPSGKGESISDVVMRIKSLCALSLRNECHVYLKWQTSFYDHILRDSAMMDREFNAVKQYIIDNLARSGIVGPYPFLFSES
jgi:REP element-mobilizing transposase RayT